jgi:hypothetical protein
MLAALFNDTSGKGHQGCDLVVEQIRSGLARRGIEIAWTQEVGVDWRPIREEILKKPPVDVIVVNGEGSIHHSASRPRAAYLPALGPFARDFMKLPAFLINSTIFEITTETANNISAFSGIYVRDTGSVTELRQHGILNCSVIADLTICAKMPALDRKKSVGVTDSIRPDVTALLREKADTCGWTFQPMQSYSLMNRILRKRWSRRIHAHKLLRPPDIARFAASHRAIITGRFHAVTLCIATRTPFVALASNTPKIEWLLDDVFGSRRRLISPAELIDLDISHFDSWLPTEAQSIDITLEKTRDGAAEMFRLISNAPKQISAGS